MGAVNVFCVVWVSRWHRSDMSHQEPSPSFCARSRSQRNILLVTVTVTVTRDLRKRGSTDGGGEEGGGGRRKKKGPSPFPFTLYTLQNKESWRQLMQGIFEWRFNKSRITRWRTFRRSESCWGLWWAFYWSWYFSMHGNYVYFGQDWIGFVWFGSVEFSSVLARFPPTMR